MKLTVRPLLILIFVTAILIRFYNFENRINFGLEQALPLLTSANYLEKPSLLGLESVRRTTSLNHSIYFSPFFTYTLLPLQLITNFNPLLITAFFSAINIVTGLILYLVTYKIFTKRIAIWTLFLFLFNSIMISHSLFIWINNYTVFINTLLIYLVWRIKQDNFKFASIIAGFLVGLNIGMEYMYILTGAPVVFLLILYFTKNKLQNMFLFILGVILSFSPTIIFDIRNNFYHLATLLQYGIDTIQTPHKTGFEYMHFLQFIPILCILGALLIDKAYIAKNVFAGFLLAIYFVVNISSPDISFTKAIGMADGLTYPILYETARAISEDNPNNFNIASTFDLDSRALGIRYLLERRFDTKPLGVIEYPEADILYVIAKINYDFTNAPWEITSFSGKYQSTYRQIHGYNLYKFTKEQ